MNPQNVQHGLAHGQQIQAPMDTGACGGGVGAGYPYGAGGLYGAGCTNPWALNPGVTPTFGGLLSGGVVLTYKTVGACGILGADGTVYRYVTGLSAYAAAGDIDINGAATDIGWTGGFVPTIEDIGDSGRVRLTIDDGYATVCGWKWMNSEGILIVRARAEKGFVDNIIQTPADAFNIDGCECPVAFTCITDEEGLELDLALACGETIRNEDILVVAIQGETPDGAAVAFGLYAEPFSFALYLNVYETVGTCGQVAPLYNLAPNQTPILPAPPQGPCGPAALQSGPAYGQPGMGMPNGYANGYMQPGMTG